MHRSTILVVCLGIASALWLGRYQVVPFENHISVQPSFMRLDRWTGEVTICIIGKCYWEPAGDQTVSGPFQ